MDGNPLSKLADIDLPPAPDWQPFITGAAVGVVAVLLVLGGTIYLWRRRRRASAAPAAPRRALGRFEQLARLWRDKRLDDRETSYRLAALLRLSLAVEQLDERCPAVLVRHREQWDATVALLQRLRYQRSPSARLREEDFQHIRQWLETAARQP